MSQRTTSDWNLKKYSELTHKSWTSIFVEAKLDMIVKYTDDYVSFNAI